MKVIEEWRDIQDWKGWYQVSNFGRVRRMKAGPGAQVGKVLAQQRACTGGQYRVVTLHGGSVGRRETRYAHRMVMAAFAGPCPKGLVVNHKDSNPSNNHVQNLEYCTRSQNANHAIGSGVKFGSSNPVVGSEHGKSKFTEDDIVLIRQRRSQGERIKSIAKDYPVHFETIGRICRRVSWTHVD